MSYPSVAQRDHAAALARNERAFLVAGRELPLRPGFARFVPVDVGMVLRPVAEGLAAAAARYVECTDVVAVEHGHRLTGWRGTKSMVMSARCERCGTSAGLTFDGAPLPSSTIGAPCRADRPRFYVAKVGRSHYVNDSERPMYAGRSCATKGAAVKLAAQLNAPTVDVVPAAVEGRDVLVAKAAAKVARAERALAKARAELVELEGSPVARLEVVSVTVEERPTVEDWLAAVLDAATSSPPAACPAAARRLPRLDRVSA